MLYSEQSTSLCDCLLLTQEEVEPDTGQHVPIPQQLYTQLYARLQSYITETTPFSMLLLHASQRAYPSLTSYKEQERRQHSMPGFLEQLLVNVRRVIRTDDEILAQQDIAAAILFPAVDQHSLVSILERIYQSVSLLQAETVVPPLRNDTLVQFGMGTATTPETTVEQIIHAASREARTFVLRPVLPHTLLHAYTRQPLPSDLENDNIAAPRPSSRVPFMHLPPKLSARLRHVISYRIAQELRCAPVGRNNHCLTVAMATPDNSSQIHYLASITGMTIFPVSCSEDELDLLLSQEW